MSRKTTASRKKTEQGRAESPAESKSVSSPTPVTKTRRPASAAAERSAPAPEPAPDPKPSEAAPSPSPAEEAKRRDLKSMVNAADLWQKLCRIELRRIRFHRAPSWLTGLLRHRPSGLEIMVGLLILVATIMVGLQLFGSRARRHPTPAVLSRSDSRKVPPGVVQVLNTLERNAQEDRRTVSRIEAMLNGMRLQFYSLRKTIQSRSSAPTPAAGSPGSAASARPEAPPPIPPVAARPSAAPDRRLIDLEIRLDELARKVQALQKRLGRTGRPR
jgi:hypothetical protein